MGSVKKEILQNEFEKYRKKNIHDTYNLHSHLGKIEKMKMRKLDMETKK